MKIDSQKPPGIGDANEKYRTLDMDIIAISIHHLAQHEICIFSDEHKCVL